MPAKLTSKKKEQVSEVDLQTKKGQCVFSSQALVPPDCGLLMGHDPPVENYCPRYYFLELLTASRHEL